jgi:hypothetical protein
MVLLPLVGCRLPDDDEDLSIHVHHRAVLVVFVQSKKLDCCRIAYRGFERKAGGLKR